MTSRLPDWRTGESLDLSVRDTAPAAGTPKRTPDTGQDTPGPRDTGTPDTADTPAQDTTPDTGQDTPDSRDTGQDSGTPDTADPGHGTRDGQPDTRDRGQDTPARDTTPDTNRADTGQDTDQRPDDTTHHGRARAWSWHWLTVHLHPWKTLIALILVLIPMPWTGYSAATTWAYTVHETRDTSLYAAYALAFGAFALAVAADRRRPRLLTRITGAITFIGIFGAVHWYDPVTILTGVQL